MKNNKYNYRTFELTVFPYLQKNLYTLATLVEDYKFRYNANPNLYIELYTSKTLSRILGKTLPKVVNMGYIQEKYIADIYVLYQIAYWDVNTLLSAERNQYGGISYKTEQHKPLHYNNHAYTGTETDINNDSH